MRNVALTCVLLSAVGLPAWPFDVPSGQPLELQEVLVEEIAARTWVRFRFVAPDIARVSGKVDYSTAAADMLHLCDSMVLPYLEEHALEGDVIVVSMADRQTEFGAPEPDVTQFFEAFHVENARCIWEVL